MKLSNLVLIFAAVTEARKVGVGSRWEKKQGLYVILHRLCDSDLNHFIKHCRQAREERDKGREQTGCVSTI